LSCVCEGLVEIRSAKETLVMSNPRALFIAAVAMTAASITCAQAEILIAVAGP
jgi:hypothetical protein